MGKRYYWLKLKDDFFTSKRIKKLRNMAGGDTYTIIYLKMQLVAMKTDGVLSWIGVEDDFTSELALDLDEDPEDIEVTLHYLLKVGLAETQDNKEFFFPYAVENTGSETAGAKRMRDYRKRKKSRNDESASHRDTSVTQALRKRDGEKEIEKEIEIESTATHSQKKKYGEYGWIKLTDEQYQKLVEDLGESELDRCIQYIDESAQSTQNKNRWKDWNLVIRRCSREGWGKKRKAPSQDMSWRNDVYTGEEYGEEFYNPG